MAQSRLDELRTIDPVLTTIAQGYSNSAMVADKLLPVVNVPKQKGKIPIFGKEAFLVRDYHRAIRAQSNRIPPSDIELVDYQLEERDVEIAIDYIEEEEANNLYRYEQRITKELMDILLLAREKEIADYVQNPDNFQEDLKLEITESSAFNNYYNTTNPITVIEEAKSAVQQRIARYPNTMIMGESVYKVLINHPLIVSRIQYSDLTKVSLNVLRELFEIPNIYIGTAVYSEDGAEFKSVWEDNIIIAYVDENEKKNRSEFNPSYGYILQKEGMPEIDTYFENGGKIKVVRNTDNFCFQIVSPDCAYLIYNTIHPLESNL